MARRGRENERAPRTSAPTWSGAKPPGGRSDGRKLTAKLAPTKVVVPAVRTKRRTWSHHRSCRRSRKATDGGTGGPALMASGLRIAGRRPGSRLGRGGGRRAVGEIAQLLAGLEADREAGRDLDFLGWPLRVAADPLLPRLDEENAEPAQLDPLAARQRLAHDVDDRLDRERRLLAGHGGRFRDAVDDVVLDHAPLV